MNSRAIKTTSANEIFEEFINSLLASGDYLDAITIKAALENTLNLNRLEAFRTIQLYNKKVESIIDAYFSSRSLYYYTELERAIIKSFAIWQKLDPVPETFEELGIGNLLRCSKIIEKFGFPVGIHRNQLHEPEPKTIFEALQSYMQSMRNYRTYEKGMDDHIYMCMKAKMPRNKVLAVLVEGRDLFYSYRAVTAKKSTFNITAEIEAVHNDYILKKRQALHSSYDSLIQHDSSHFSTEIEVLRVDLKELLEDNPSYQPMYNLMRSLDSYPSLIYKFYHTFFSLVLSSETGHEEKQVRERVRDENLTLKEQLFLSTWEDITLSRSEFIGVKLFYKDDDIKHAAMFSVSSLVYCLAKCKHVFEVLSGDNMDNLDDELPTEGPGLLTIRILRSYYTQDIPDFALNKLEILLQGLITKNTAIIKPAQEGIESIEFDLRALYDEACRKLVRTNDVTTEDAESLNLLKASKNRTHCPYCNKKLKNIFAHVQRKHPEKLGITVGSQSSIPQRHFIAVATAVILFHRIMFIENVIPKNLAHDEMEAVFECHVQNCLEGDGKQELDMPSLVANLQFFENEVKTILDIPAFECSGLGSFLSFINRPYQISQIEKLFSIKASTKQIEDKVLDTPEYEQGDVDSTRLDVDSLHTVLDDILVNAEYLKQNSFALIRLLEYVQQQIGYSNGKYFLTLLLDVIQQDLDLAAKFDTIFNSCATNQDHSLSEEHDKINLENCVSFEVNRHSLVSSIHLIRTMLTTALNTGFDRCDLSPEQFLIKQAQWLTVSFFHIPPQVALHLCYEVISREELRFDHQLHKFCPSIDNKAAHKSLIIVWCDLITEELSNPGSRDQWATFMQQNSKLDHMSSSINYYDIAVNKPKRNAEISTKLLNLLSHASLGKSCTESAYWLHYRSILATDPADDAPTLLEFMIDNESNLMNLMQDSVLSVTGRMANDGGYDCVRLSTKLLLGKELRQKFILNDHDAIASSLLSAAGNIARAEASTADSVLDPIYLASLRSCFLELFESRGSDAFIDIVTYVLDTVMHIYPLQLMSLTATLLHLLILMVAEVAGINAESVEKKAWAITNSDIKRCLSTLALQFPSKFQYLKLVVEDFILNGSIDYSSVMVGDKSGKSAAPNSNFLQLQTEIVSLDSIAVQNTLTSQTSEKVADLSRDFTSESKDVNQDFILNLLQKEFHYDEHGRRPIDESPEGRKLRCSLDLLSASLYSSDVHFVMELLQNADDNSYLEDVVPTLKLQLFPHALVILNNEVGFSPENIVAVCNVGGSTKKGLSGYIGQKGIGFKSVFSISDRPEIHSKGFHIMFDKDVSMLEPIWLEDAENGRALGRWPNKLDVLDGTYYETCVRLILNDSSLKNIAKLTHEMEEVFDGKLILFLNKLQRMVLENRNDKSSMEHYRSRLSPYWTKIASKYLNVVTHTVVHRSTAIDVYWWTVRCCIEEPIVRRLNVHVSSTEIVLAFKFTEMLEEDGNTGSKQEEANNHKATHRVLKLDFNEGLLPIYAFLPTLTQCFNFIIQGDFVLATSRESVLDGNDWNIMLIERIPELFIGAVQELVEWMRLRPKVALEELLHAKDRQNSNLEQLRALCPRLINLAETENADIVVSFADIIALIPLTSQVNKHLHPMLFSIYDKLKDLPFIPTQLNELKSPKDILITRDLYFDPSLYISVDILQDSAQKSLIGYDQQMTLDEEVVGILDLKGFKADHLLSCAKELQRRLECDINPLIGESYVKMLGGLLYALSLIMAPKSDREKIKADYNGKKPLVPTQALRGAKSRVKETNAQIGGLASSFTHKDVINAFKELSIWPLQGNAMSSLVSATVFVQCHEGSKANSISNHQWDCIKLFQDEISVLDENIFRYLDSNFMPSVSSPNGRLSEKLRSFLLQFFAPPSIMQLSMNNKMPSGGLCVMTSDLVLSTIILPAFRLNSVLTKQHENNQVENEVRQKAIDAKTCSTQAFITRTKAAAYLAFIYATYIENPNSSSSKRLLDSLVNDSGVLVPTLSAKDKSSKKELYWSNSEVHILKAYSLTSFEIHTGSEFADSFTTELTRHMTLTALRQMAWTVVDPLATALALGLNHVNLLSDQDNLVMLANTDVSFLCKRVNFEKISAWKKFLQKLGVVDFFKVHMHTEEGDITPEKCIPGLVAYFGHMLRNGQKVSTISDGRNESFSMYSIPLFLPRSWESKGSQQILKVTKEVYQIMKTLLAWIHTELQNSMVGSTSLSISVKSCVTSYIQSTAWCPIDIAPEVSRLLSSVTGTVAHSDIYLLAPPRDILMGESAQDVGKPIIGNHFAYLPRDVYPVPLGTVTYGSVEGYLHWYNFYVASERIEPDISLLVSLLTWQSQLPPNTTLYSRTDFYQWIYNRMMKYLEASQTESSIVKNAIAELLSSNSRLLWIPDNVEDIGNGYGSYYPGTMVALSDVVKDDATKFLQFDKSPVKVLLRYYPTAERHKKARALYARNDYCYRCKAAEGMFGVRGKARNDDSLSYTCTCLDESIGKFLSSLPGLINESPTLLHMISLLVYHKQVIETKSKTADNVARESRKEFMRILSSISSNIWKCFQIKGALHPYSSKQLQGFVESFQHQSLLPGVGSLTSFVSRNEENILAIDDLAMYEAFRTSIDKQSFTLVDSGLQNDDDGDGLKRVVRAFFTLERLGGINTGLYDLIELEADQKTLLNSTDMEFRIRTSRIPPLTFFAPRNMLPLFKLLQIPLLSDFVKIETQQVVAPIHRKDSDRSVAIKIAELLTDMLMLSQAYIRRELERVKTLDDSNISPAYRILKSFAVNPIPEYGLLHKLEQAARVQKLLNSKVLQCSSLVRHLKLLLPSTAAAECTVEDIVQLKDSETSYEIYLSTASSADILPEIAVELIVQVLKFELALITENQQVEFMEKIEEFLMKFSKESKQHLAVLLKFENLEEFYQNSTWKLNSPVDIIEHITPANIKEEKVEVAMEEESMEAIEEADQDDSKENDEEYDDEEGEQQAAKSMAGFAALKEKAAERAKARAAQKIAENTKKQQQEKVVSEAAERVMEQRKEKSIELARQLIGNAVIIQEDAPNNMSRNAVDRTNGGKREEKVVVEYVKYDGAHRSSQAPQVGDSEDIIREGIVERVNIVSNGTNSTHSQESRQALDPNARPKNVIYWRSYAPGSTPLFFATASLPATVLPAHLPGAPANEQGTAGRWSPTMAYVNNLHAHGASSNSIHNVDVPPELLQRVLDVELNQNQAYQSAAHSVDIPLVSNALTGRLGEQLAKQFLLSVAPVYGIASVVWCNEQVELGLPYDLEVTLLDGKRKQVEVKTRSASQAGVRHSVWPISFAELQTARSLSLDYCLVLFSLQIDYPARAFGLQRAVVLGWQEGLASCLTQGEASQLLIQVPEEGAEKR